MIALPLKCIGIGANNAEAAPVMLLYFGDLWNGIALLGYLK